jgi:hypothetical protein
MYFISGLVLKLAQLGTSAKVNKLHVPIKTSDSFQQINHPSAIHIQIDPRFPHGKRVRCGGCTIENDILVNNLMGYLLKIQNVIITEFDRIFNIMNIV